MNAIAVVDRNWAIGCGGGLLFSLPGDLKRFRRLTLEGTVILGRKTLDSFPGGKPLPKRRNIVITQRPALTQAGVEIAPSPEAAVEAAEGTDTVWVIGGGSVYAALLSQCRQVYLTKVDAAAEKADTFFPNLDNLPEWEIAASSELMEENGLTYRFVDYVNTKWQI